MTLAFGLAACTPDEETVQPLKTTNQDEIVGYDDSGCNMMQLYGDGAKPSNVFTIIEDGIEMRVTAQRRGHNGKYLPETAALLLDPAQHPELVSNSAYTNIGMNGLLTVPDEAGTYINEKGGRVILDFSATGSLTMKNMVFTDIDADEAGTKIELFSNTGQLLMTKDIPLIGDKGSVIVGLDNQPGVSKIIVTFGEERTGKGSGTIGRIQMCRDGMGQCISACTREVNTVWLQYVGSRPINVKALSQNAVLLRSNGMKPGTIFKVEHAEDLINALQIETNHKGVPDINLTCNDGLVSLTENNSLFRLIDARGAGIRNAHCMQ